MSGYHSSAFEGLAAGVGDGALQFALLTATHPVISFAFIAGGCVAVLLRAAAQPA